MTSVNYFQENDKAKNSLLNFDHLIKPRIHELRNFVENLNQEEKTLKSILEKFPIDKNNLQFFELDTSNGQPNEISKYNKIVENGEVMNNFNQEMEDLANSINNKKFDIDKNKKISNSINYLLEFGKKFASKIVNIGDEIFDISFQKVYLENIEKIFTQQENLMNLIQNDYKNNIFLIEETKKISSHFENMEEKINDNLTDSHSKFINYEMDKFNNTELPYSFEYSKDEIYCYDYLIDYKENKLCNFNNGLSFPIDTNAIDQTPKYKNLFLNNKSSENFNITPVKVKKDFKTLNENSFETNKNSNQHGRYIKNHTNHKKHSKKRHSLELGLTRNKSSAESLTKVELNKVFITVRKKRPSQNIIEDKVYLQNEYCKKYCGEKLFKNLDLNQRFYLKKTGQPIIHNPACPLFNKKTNLNKTASVPISYREKRKINVEKQLKQLDLSLAAVRSNSVIDTGKSNKTTIVSTKSILSSKNTNASEIHESRNLNFIKFNEQNRKIPRHIEVKMSLIDKKGPEVMKEKKFELNKSDKKPRLTLIHNKIDYSGITSRLNINYGCKK